MRPPQTRSGETEKPKARAAKPIRRAAADGTAKPRWPEVVHFYHPNGPLIIVVCEQLTRAERVRAGCR
jgi:hypothetical protein